MSDYEKRVEVRRVVARFPTGEVKHTESLGLRWVDEDTQAPDGEFYCSVPSTMSESREWNIRRKDKQ